MGREPGSRSAAACLALGDNILSVPRKREGTVVRRLLSHTLRSRSCVTSERAPCKSYNMGEMNGRRVACRL